MSLVQPGKGVPKIFHSGVKTEGGEPWRRSQVKSGG